MIKIYLLTAWVGTGLFYLPFPTLQACNEAMQLLDYRVAYDVSCVVVTAVPKGSKFAPEVSPVPRARPQNSVYI